MMREPTIYSSLNYASEASLIDFIFGKRRSDMGTEIIVLSNIHTRMP